MKSPKKIKKQRPVVLYERDITKIKRQIADRMLCLVTGYLMDELDYDEDKIVELWMGITRYSEAIKDHTITLNKVRDIIEEKTGIKMLGRK